MFVYSVWVFSLSKRSLLSTLGFQRTQLCTSISGNFYDPIKMLGVFLPICFHAS